MNYDDSLNKKVKKKVLLHNFFFQIQKTILCNTAFVSFKLFSDSVGRSPHDTKIKFISIFLCSDGSSKCSILKLNCRLSFDIQNNNNKFNCPLKRKSQLVFGYFRFFFLILNKTNSKVFYFLFLILLIVLDTFLYWQMLQ